MGTVIMHSVMSVDGFIADRNDDVGPLHDWYFSGDTPIVEGGDQEFDHSGAGGGWVSRASAEYVRPQWEAVGAIVMGRTLFDLVNGWEGIRPQVTTWSWCPTGPSPKDGTPRRRTISSTTWRPRSTWPRSWPGTGSSV